MSIPVEHPVSYDQSADAIRMGVNGHDVVELQRIQTAESVPGWVLQLSEKSWATKHNIGSFVRLVYERKGWRLDYL